MARLSFRCDEELVQRVDAERGLIPREAWLRRAIEQALGGPVSTPGTDALREERRREAASEEHLAESYRQSVPGPNVENIRSSSQAKRNVRPEPKRAR